MELNKYIVVKFSELYLKGGNKKEFLYTLIRNIKTKLSASKIEFKLKNKFDRLEIISNKLEDVFNELKYVVGLSSYYYCFEFETSKENIEKIIYSELSNFSEKTKFRVSSKIIGENNFFSKKEDLINWIAWLLTEKFKFKIDLKNYFIDVNIKIDGSKTILFFKKEKGIEGLPSGSSGKAIALLSGGIDSPVAAFKTISRGINVSFLTFLTTKTSTSDTLSKIKELAKEVNKYNGINGKLFFVNFEPIQEKIAQLEDTSYRIILLRRFFMKFAQKLSKKYNYKFIITGDSLGQVASQTPESLTQINNSIDQLIIRPLISTSKNEIIRIAQEIDTYKISIKPGNDMCVSFNPKNPIIFPTSNKIKELESKLVGMDNILDNILKENLRIINIEDID